MTESFFLKKRWNTLSHFNFFFWENALWIGLQSVGGWKCSRHKLSEIKTDGKSSILSHIHHSFVSYSPQLFLQILNVNKDLCKMGIFPLGGLCCNKRDKLGYVSDLWVPSECPGCALEVGWPIPREVLPWVTFCPEDVLPWNILPWHFSAIFKWLFGWNFALRRFGWHFALNISS